MAPTWTLGLGDVLDSYAQLSPHAILAGWSTMEGTEEPRIEHTYASAAVLNFCSSVVVAPSLVSYCFFSNTCTLLIFCQATHAAISSSKPVERRRADLPHTQGDSCKQGVNIDRNRRPER
eukprot:jgi/Mesen1/6200/ME000032S05482